MKNRIPFQLKIKSLGVPKELPWWGKILRDALRWLGDIEIYHYPLFILSKTAHHRLTAKEKRVVMDQVKPGDVLLRKQIKPFMSKFIPGHYTHAAIMLSKKTVIHAIGEGVVECDIIEFLECDAIAILRPPHFEELAHLISVAHQCLGKEYDWIFDSKDSSRFSCTELVAFCIHDYPDIHVKFRESGFTKGNIAPDDFFTFGLKTIHDSRTF